MRRSAGGWAYCCLGGDCGLTWKKRVNLRCAREIDHVLVIFAL